MAACITPQIGGNEVSRSFSQCRTCDSSLTSHFCTITRTSGHLISSRRQSSLSFAPPLLDSKIILRAPRSVIHLAIERPRPPVPPMITWLPLDRKMEVDLGCTTCHLLSDQCLWRVILAITYFYLFMKASSQYNWTNSAFADQLQTPRDLGSRKNCRGC
jgi:hypothetical protein